MEQNVQPFEQNENNTLVLASVGARFVARLLDSLILVIPTFVVGLVPIVGALLSFVLGWLYYAKMEELVGGTFGKRIMGIQVVTEEGTYQTFWQASLRYVVRQFLSGILIIGYLMAFFTEKRQTLHDLIAKTYVIQKASGELPSFGEFVDSTKKSFSGLSVGGKNANTMKEIEKLKELLDSGVITKEEFEQKKAELLQKIQ